MDRRVRVKQETARESELSGSALHRFSIGEEEG